MVKSSRFPTERFIPLLKAVLFDLDGTLLDIDLGRFLHEYFAALGPVVAEVAPGIKAEEGRRAVLAGTEAMSRPHPGQTNREVFNARFHELTSANLDLEEIALPFERFYRETFPGLRASFGPFVGARGSVKLCLELGLKVAIATNPIFPRDAIIERMRWAGIDDLKVHLVTTYENMHATKPHAAYFAETAALLGVAPASCVMVGDDRSLDMPAADLGMRTFYVGPDRGVPSDWRGNLVAFEELLPRLLARPRIFGAG
jgi:FMN phosphatase YigB (HAD superfamily)